MKNKHLNAIIINSRSSLFCIIYYIIVALFIKIIKIINDNSAITYSIKNQILSISLILIISILLGILNIYLIKNPIISKYSLILEIIFILLPAVIIDISWILMYFNINIPINIISNIKILIMISGCLSIIEIFRIIHFIKRAE